VVNITSSAVKAPIPELGLSNGARSGLTGFVAGVARQLAEHGITINNLLPGLFYTDRLKNNFAFLSDKTGKTHAEIFAAKSAANPSKRLGNPAEFGAVCAFMCSTQAAYLNGQNILLDGGNYPGTF
jgi:3-oxoacyl-[acyl-carrier protein] reductase